jgi:hypothetical protein
VSPSPGTSGAQKLSAFGADPGSVAVVQDIPWYKSTTFWGIAVPVVLNVLSVVLHKNISLSSEETAGLVQSIASASNVIGAIVALWGRSTAVSGGVARSLYFTSPKH